MDPVEKELIIHPDRQGLRMVLGDLEAGVMDVIWRQPEGEWCTVRDVYETMLQERRIAYTTVMNTMTRLANKGVLESSKQGMVYLYRPHQSREAFIQGVVGHVLDRLLVQFKGPAQAAIEDYAAKHPAESKRVEQLLGELQQRRAPNSKQEPSESTDTS